MAIFTAWLLHDGGSSARSVARDVLLAGDPDVDGLDVGAGHDAVLGHSLLFDAANLGRDAVLARVAGQHFGAVLEFVLRVAAAAQAHGGDDAVRRLAGAGVDVHGVERHGGAGVGGKADELFERGNESA
jgi:hypothetical protein